MTVAYEGDVKQATVNQYAFHLISSQDYTENALRKKLNQRFPVNADFHDACITTCKHYDYINDQRFAHRYAIGLSEQGVGLSKIKDKMRKKDFSLELISQAINLEEVITIQEDPDGAPATEALIFAESLIKSSVGINKIKERMYVKGFSRLHIDLVVSSESITKHDTLPDALYWREKWYGQSLFPDFKEKQKCIIKLARKGFSFSDAKKATEYQF
jgi:SOS response regulatory protein OraA/RecX